jgi:Flp pilus assembly protein TadB
MRDLPRVENSKMKRILRSLGIIAFALLLCFAVLRWLGAIYAVSLGFFAIAVSIVFVAVISKAYKKWPV